MMQPHTAAHSFSHSIGIGFFAARPRALLTLVEELVYGLLAHVVALPDGRLVHEHLVALIIRRDEAEALLRVEPLHASRRHR